MMSRQGAPPSPASSTVRAVVVALIGLWTLAYTLPASSLLWHPPAELGIAVDADGVVKGVSPGSAAAAAHIVPGDRVDLRNTSFAGRLDLFLTAPNPNAKIQTRIFHGSVPVSVTLIARPGQRFSAVETLIFVARELATVVFVAIGAWLVLLRPTRMTWGFYLYCALGSSPISFGHIFYAFLPADWRLVLIVAWDILFALAPIGFLVFAMRFPRETVSGWRRVVDQAAPAAFVILAAISVYPDIATPVYGLGSQAIENILFGGGYGAIYLFGAASLFGTYVQAVGADRQRLKWVVVGLAIGFGGYFADILLSNGVIPGLQAPQWLEQLFGLLNLSVPLTVAYAVVHHRVIDVRFIIGRTLAYGALTSILVAIFAFIDWLLGMELASTRLALSLEILVAIALGFWLNGLHRRVDHFVDSVFFRHRYAAERRLAQTAVALPHAGSSEAVNHFLVHEPAEALELASAALFRRRENGEFVREAAAGWSDIEAQTLEPNDPLVLNAHAHQVPLRVAEIAWHRQDRPAGSGDPVLALPILIRRQLVALALYGAHRSGADLDPDEISAISGLAVAASAAYDHLEAQEMRQQSEALRTQLKAVTDELETWRVAAQNAGPQADSAPAAG